MKDNLPLISIIIPIYNVQLYLKRCVDSILSQTYRNLEIFLVDDGSPDDCGRMCDEYAKVDSRIKVIHKKNGGLSDARNVAIDIASGDYILCVDSDDYVHHTMVETLYLSLKEYKCDISVASHLDVTDQYKLDLSSKKENQIEVFDTQSGLETMLYQRGITTSAWGKLYKAELFTDVRYPKGKLCEDLDTTYKLFAKSKKIVLNSAKLYFYLQRNNSIIKSSFKPARMDALNFAEDQLVFIETRFPAIKKAACNRLFMEAIFIMLTMQKATIAEYSTSWRKCVSIIKKYRKTVLCDTKSRAIYRLYAALSLISPKLIYTVNGLKNHIKLIIGRMA